MLIESFVKMLSNVSWPIKVFLYSTVFIILIVAVGIFGAYTISKQNFSIEQIVQNSQERVNGATNARVSIVELERALASVIAASDRKEVRVQAITAIRALSMLDEHIQKLGKSLTDSSEVEDLAKTIKRIRPVQMEVIKAAKKDDDPAAMDAVKRINQDSIKINELSQKIVNQERHLLTEIQQNTSKKGTQVISIMIWLIIGGALLGVVSSVIAARLLVRPLTHVERTMESVANGNLSVQFNDAGSDEIGRTVKAIALTVKNLRELLSNVLSGSTELTQQSALIGSTASTIQQVSSVLHAKVSQIKDSNHVVLEVTGDVSERLHKAAISADKTTESSTQAVNEIMTTVKEFEQFQSRMEDTANTTRQLSEAAEKVTSITDTINNISSQTNLLALNAAIEAARAGEHGRGFAVVADEVRTLAKRTDDSTGEITELVENISTSIAATVSALESSVDDAKSNIKRLTVLASEIMEGRERAGSLKESMQEIVELMVSQEQAIDNITSAVEELDQVSDDTSEQSEVLHGLADSLNQASTGLNGMVDRFTL